MAKRKQTKPTIGEYLEEAKIWSVPLLVGTVILVLGWLVVKPRVFVIHQALTERKELRQKLSNIVVKLEKLENVNTDQFRSHLVLLSEALPNEPNLFMFLLGLDRLAGQVGIAIESVGFGDLNVIQEPRPQKQPQEIPVTLSFRGRPDQASNFVKILAQSRRLVSIENLKYSLVRSTGASPSANYRGTLSLTTYYAPFPRSLGEPDEPLGKFSSEEESLVSEIQNRPSSMLDLTTIGQARPATGAADKKNPFEP
jgi:Tfp pilus assembly protein PilO